MKQNGFAQILFISLLPILLAIIMLTFIGANYIQLQTRTETICLTEQIKTQKKVATMLNLLLDLNPIAMALKIIDDGGTIAQLGALFLAPALIPIIERIKKIARYGRRLIDYTQKYVIIQGSRALYFTSSLKIAKQHQDILKQNLSYVSPFIQSSYTPAPASINELAVKQDYKDLAPTYSVVKKRSTKCK